MILNDCDFVKAKSKAIDERYTTFISKIIFFFLLLFSEYVFRSPFLEYPVPGMNFTNKMESPRILKTHLPYEFLPDDIENKSKVIYIVR